jgi:phage/plasmid-associated DNA primase
VKIAFEVSFLGREDNALLGKLRQELSGIAWKCFSAYRRTKERGRFIQPRSAQGLEDKIRHSSDPFTQFVEETFIADARGTVKCTDAYNALVAWCAKDGRDELLRSVTRQNMSRFLRAIPNFEGVRLAPRPHDTPRFWAGLRIRKAAERRDTWEGA